MRLLKLIRWLIIALPAFLFLCVLILPFIPGAMGLFSDGPKPWFEPVTSGLFLAGLIYAYPMTFLCTHLVSDDMFLSPGFFVVLFVYTTLWMFLLRIVLRYFEQRAGKTR